MSLKKTCDRCSCVDDLPSRAKNKAWESLTSPIDVVSRLEHQTPLPFPRDGMRVLSDRASRRLSSKP